MPAHRFAVRVSRTGPCETSFTDVTSRERSESRRRARGAASGGYSGAPLPPRRSESVGPHPRVLGPQPQNGTPSFVATSLGRHFLRAQRARDERSESRRGARGAVSAAHAGAPLPPRRSESVGAPPSGFGAPTPKHQAAHRRVPPRAQRARGERSEPRRGARGAVSASRRTPAGAGGRDDKPSRAVQWV